MEHLPKGIVTTGNKLHPHIAGDTPVMVGITLETLHALLRRGEWPDSLLTTVTFLLAGMIDMHDNTAAVGDTRGRRIVIISAPTPVEQEGPPVGDE